MLKDNLSVEIAMELGFVLLIGGISATTASRISSFGADLPMLRHLSI
jgi:hypothetical protein